MEQNSKEELIALIKYMIDHNEHHNKELEELSNSLKDVNNEAYLKVEEAIKSFEKGNKQLSSALKELKK